ncbi:hypothetical protein EQ811_11745 [Staphylococcus capitis]|uniref:Uncharacterized protein n=3 Tax=Staphylococcus capitis TaxID=29388 RepID=A0A7Z7YTC4_STACP|nr:hypothetical protein [Staphylococcus capitis]MDS4004862.1 hypothetical protein [Staphylococcus capitis]TBW75377.1 hypothetical protein EQ811_11745 [Staphylococcus capitis]
MFQKQKYKYIIKQLNSRKMNIDLYSELCLLFEIYNDLNIFYDVQDMEQLKISRLIKDIAFTFNESLSYEDLINIYPMYIKEHIHFAITSNITDKKKQLIRKLFLSQCIQKNEWLDTEYDNIKTLYSYICENSDYNIDSKKIVNKLKLSNIESFNHSNTEVFSLEEYIDFLNVISQSSSGISKNIIDILIGELKYVK